MISCSVRTDTVGVNGILCRFSRHAYDPSSTFSVSTSHLISIHASSHLFRKHLTSAQQFRPHRTSDCLVDRTSHPILSVDNTHFLWSLKLPDLFFSEDVKVPSRPATTGFDDQELAARWSTVAKLRNRVFSWNGDSFKANRNGFGDVEGLRSYAQALIPVLDREPSGFSSHASMRDVLQAVHKTHEVFGQMSDAQLWVTTNRTSECWRLMCKHVYNSAKTRAVIEDAVVKSTVAQINLPVNAGGDVYARVAGGELEAAAKTVTGADFVHRSSSHVRGFQRRPSAGA